MIVALVLLALILAGALAWPDGRQRVRLALVAAVAAPVLLVVHISGTSAFTSLTDRPALLAAAAAAGVAAVVALAALVVRRPAALPVLAVAALPFRVPIAVGGSTSNLLLPLYVVVGAGALAFAWRHVRAGTADGLPPGWLERALALVLVLYAVQATYSDDVDHAVENVLFFYAPFALLFVLLQQVDWTRRLALQCLGVLAGLALLLVGIGFVEYATRTLLLNPKVISSNQFEEYFRVNSLFFDPNIYGRFLALVMLAVTTVLLWTTRGGVVAGVAVVLAVLWAGLVLTFSQSSFTALIVGLAVLAALRWNPRLALGAVATLALVGAAVVLVAPDAINLNTNSTEGLDNATSGRYELLAGGGRLATERPAAGWGSGAFARTFRREETASDQQAVAASHTIPMTVAAEQGVPGLLAYLGLLGVAFARLARGARRDPARAFVLAAFSAIVVHTLLYAAFLEDPLTWALLAVGSALASRPA